MSRVVAFEDAMSIDQLKRNVIGEFFADGGSEIDVELSYWPPNTTELATGITTPPVIVTSGASISYFCKHFRVNHSMNLFANFSKRVISTSSPAGPVFSDGFKTPMPTTKRARFTDDLCGEGMFGSSVGSRKVPPEIDDDLMASHMEKVENIMRSGSHRMEDLFNLNTSSEKSVQEYLDEINSDISGIQYDSEDLNTDDEDNGQESWDNFDVRPLGIDEEFWEPLVDEVHGGSDAADFMCPDVDPPVNAGPTVYTCSTNDAFDHTVIAGGDGSVWKSEAASGASSASGGSRSGSSPDRSEQANTPPNTFNRPTSKPNVYSHNGGFAQSSGGTNTNVNGQHAMDSSCRQHTPCTGDRVRAKSTHGRSLGEIDDEEFDIPLMFDDLLYESADIPDLDIDELGGEVSVGKVFSNKKDCQVALAIYATKNMFNFRHTTTKANYFVLNCTDRRCDWRVLAIQVKNCGYYEIKKANFEHSCCIETKSMFKKRASCNVIAAVFKAKYGDPVKGPRAADLQQLVLEELRVAASYMKCYRAREKAITYVRGTDDDSYLGLPEYLYMLKLANPGTVTDLIMEKDAFGVDRFLYLLLAFGASIRGFRRLMHVIVVDGTHLGGKFMGTLLTASGQDANFQVFPLPYAVVDSENIDSWTWFFQKLERIFADSTSLTIISDRCPSIKVAKT
ncbi:unnamed protein product [Microthlaspi erraticum]|uniref:Transposase MuDR plant domain-containing protein n=1 Tax=Microthlaspi erraticum TaxID=1685480 RepID=A0A6D2J2T7_9BRAS|nr:unnamed protein product [Microthlaspi erraticum]